MAGTSPAMTIDVISFYREKPYIASMSNKRSLLILCARIGYTPPRR
jgi:hypothetical protein